MVSEKSTTFKYKGKWINIPSIVMGEKLEDYELKELLDEGLIEPTSIHDELEEAEKAAEERSDSLEFNRGGTPMDEQMKMFGEGGLFDEGGQVDEESGNDVPIGGTKEGVRDDIPAMLSEGEFVFPEDVTRYHGLEKLMTLRQEAKMGLKKMEAMGQMGNSEDATIPDDLPFNMDDLLVVVTGEEEAEGKKDDGPIKAQAGTFVPATQQQNNMGVMGFQESMYGQQGLQNPTATVMPQVPASSVVPTVQAPQVNTGYSAPTVLATQVQQPDFVQDVSDIYKPVKYINPTSGETMTINEYQGNPVTAVPAGFVRYDDYIAGGGKDPNEEEDVTTGVESASVETAKVAGAKDDESKAKISNLERIKEEAERKRIKEYNKVFNTYNIKNITDKNDPKYVSNEMLIGAYKDQMQAENISGAMTPLIGPLAALPRLNRGQLNKALDARFGKGYSDYRDNPEFKELTKGVTRGSVLKEAGTGILQGFKNAFSSDYEYTAKYDVGSYDKKLTGTNFNLSSSEQAGFDNAVNSGSWQTAEHFARIAAGRNAEDRWAAANADLIKQAQGTGFAAEKAYNKLLANKRYGNYIFGDSTIDNIIKYGSSKSTALKLGKATKEDGLFGKVTPTDATPVTLEDIDPTTTTTPTSGSTTTTGSTGSTNNSDKVTDDELADIINNNNNNNNNNDDPPRPIINMPRPPSYDKRPPAPKPKPSPIYDDDAAGDFDDDSTGVYKGGIMRKKRKK